VSDITIGLLSALLATNQPQAVSNLVHDQTGISVAVPNVNDPTETALRNIMMQDDAALDEVHAWVSTNQIPRGDTNAIAALDDKIRARFDIVKHSYQGFLREHPDNAKGYLAYGSFLNDIGEEDAAKTEYENSRQIDPKNPAVWNQLANYYGEYGGLTNAFACYTEAIRLDPTEPVYYQNFATTVYLYRKDAKEYWGINEQQVFDKALGLYQQAMKLAPDDLVLATDYAESYYGIRPMRTNDALMAWTNCLRICKDENEREGILVHLARTKIGAGRYAEAQDTLNSITNAVFNDLKGRLQKMIVRYQNLGTNSAPATQTNTAATPATAATTATNTASTPANPRPENLEVAPPPLRPLAPSTTTN